MSNQINEDAAYRDAYSEKTHPMEGLRHDAAQAEINRLRTENNDLRLHIEQLVAACCRSPLGWLPIVKAAAELLAKHKQKGN